MSCTARILDLPKVEPDTSDVTPRIASPGCEIQLRSIQSAALNSLATYGGLVGAIGVGHGKAFIALLAASVLPDCDAAVVLVPAALRSQMFREHARLNQHFHVKPVHIHSYAELSQKKNSTLLEQYGRHYGDGARLLVVADEAHKLRDLKSARTMRLVRYFQAFPATRFAALSGTMTSRSLKDFAHLAELALRERSPLPYCDSTDLEEWCEAIDVRTGRNKNRTRDITRRAKALMEWAGTDDPVSAFAERLHTAPGVVASTDGSLGCALNIYLVSVPLPDRVAELMVEAERNQERPDGEILADDLERATCLRQLATGFYYRWDWPNDEVDHEWMDARSRWNRAVRRELDVHADAHYDSPALVRDAVLRGERPHLRSAWDGWASEKHKPQPPTVTEWVDGFFVQDVCDRAEALRRPVIIWFSSNAIGLLLRAAGMDVFMGGDNAKGYIEDLDAGVRKPGIIAMKVDPFGTGLDGLQRHYSRQIMAQMPSSGARAEQWLGRLHRVGQTADEVETWVYQHADPYVKAFASALTDAEYLETSTRNRQKLLAATIVEG